MFDSQTFIAFLAASVLIVLAPGPAQALVLARSLGSSGRRAGVLTALGLNVGTLVHAIAAGLGLSAVLATSAVAFSAVKYAGAAYLIYLGVRSVLASQQRDAASLTVFGERDSGGAFAKAIVTGVLNPKLAIFFLAFLPQFVDPARASVPLQFLFLGCVIAAIDIAYESALAYLAAGVGGRLMRHPRVATWRERITGLALIGLGLRLALSRRS